MQPQIDTIQSIGGHSPHQPSIKSPILGRRQNIDQLQKWQFSATLLCLWTAVGAWMAYTWNDAWTNSGPVSDSGLSILTRAIRHDVSGAWRVEHKRSMINHRNLGYIFFCFEVVRALTLCQILWVFNIALLAPNKFVASFNLESPSYRQPHFWLQAILLFY